MRSVFIAVAVLAAAGIASVDVQTGNAQSGTAACQGSPNALGVSRVVEIDTQGGPRFGQQQYKDISFLNEGEVVLTFDDGPLRHNTRLVLDALARHCTRATFFMVGRMAVSDPEMVRDVMRRGHTVGTHTWSHRNLRTLSADEARKELELGFSAVRLAAGAPIAPFFRFPYLSDPGGAIHHLRARDLGIFSIDVDSNDYKSPSPQLAIQRVLRGLESRKKGIVLFHDIQPATAHGLRTLLDELAARRYRIVHLVAKGPAQTVAAYDAIAEKEFGRRKTILAANPMASRAMTWPQSSQTQVTRIAPAAGAVLPPLPPANAAPVRYGARFDGALQQAAAAPPPAPLPVAEVPPPVVQPRPRVVREPSWQQKAFGSAY